MENTTYNTNGTKQSVNATLNEKLEYYLTLLGEEAALKNRLVKLQIQINDTKSDINRKLRFNTEVGQFVKVKDRIFCCMKGESDEPIIIEMQEIISEKSTL